MSDYIPPTRGGGTVNEGQRRAYLASRRMEPISSCGCIRHPDRDRHTCQSNLSERQALAAVTAASLLEQLGTPGIFTKELCRAMHRLGYTDTALRSFRYSSGEAA